MGGAINLAGPKFIDLFAGCGGLSLGLTKAGWKGCFAVEHEAFSFSSLEHNLISSEHPNRPHDVETFEWPKWLPQEPIDVNVLLRDYGENLKSLKGKISLMAGGPPCQGFSFAGKRDPADPRNKLVTKFVRAVELVEPKLVLMENVAGIASRPKGSGAQSRPRSEWLSKQLGDLGYWIWSKILRSEDYGVPQMRPRFIIIGASKESFPEEPPDPFKVLEDSKRGFKDRAGLPDRAVTVKAAINDLKTMKKNGESKRLIPSEKPRSMELKTVGRRSSYAKLMHGGLNGSINNSMGLVRHGKTVKDRYRDILARCESREFRRGVHLTAAQKAKLGIKKMCVTPLHPGKPSHTITSIPEDLIHYDEPRVLTVREMARLQSFPDWYAFQGWYGVGGDHRKKHLPRYTQVANAVPPLLAEQLGCVLIEMQKLLSGVKK